jgi:amino acid transporter
MFSKIRHLLIGKTLRSDQLASEKFSVFWGLPVLSSDAISSVAYAGQEILWVLVPILGILSYKYMFYVSLSIVFLLFLLVFSYRQTIDNYPNGGGSYIVAKDNLGTLPGLTAGASLSLDYILTVAVSICAGTDAITSAIPYLLKFKVEIALFIIIFITVGNLRGMKDSTRLFGIPTYFFILSILIMIVTGIIKYYIFGYNPQPMFMIPKATEDVTIFLIIRAFAAGCTALTGVEAVSDGIPNFKAPAQKNAKSTLTLLALVVLLIFGGIAYLSTLYHAVPNDKVTVVAQIAIQVFGNKTLMFYVVQITTAIILIMAANTSFADFPMLLSYMARDGYMPRQFTKRGKRLSFSNGIILLSLAACTLVVIFHGDTHLLMPLYAVGVFISFTLSQSGMFYKWIKEKSPKWRHKAFINGLGSIVTFITVIIIGVTKFQHGAWLVCILIPCFVFTMEKIKKHYVRVAKQLKLELNERPKDIPLSENNQEVIILIESLNKSFLKSLNYARHISKNVIAFHVSVDEVATENLKKRWNEYNVGIPLIIKQSPYRHLAGQLVKFIESEENSHKQDGVVTIVISQFMITKWWHNILHNQTSLYLKSVLLKRRNVVVVTVPYIIQE